MEFETGNTIIFEFLWFEEFAKEIILLMGAKSTFLRSQRSKIAKSGEEVDKGQLARKKPIKPNNDTKS